MKEFKVTGKNKMEVASQILALPKDSLICFQNGFQMHGVYIKKYPANAHRSAFEKIQYFDNMGKEFGINWEGSGCYSIKEFADAIYFMSHNKEYAGKKYWEV